MLTPKAYADAYRAQRVGQSLGKSATVTEAIYNAGFNSASRFYATSTRRLGMTPTQLRAGGGGTEIRFALGETSLGAMLVAATEQGICAIQFGDDPEVLAQRLQDRFPNAQLIGGDDAFEQLVAKVIGLVEAPRDGLDLPLDVRGTALQQQVWQVLRRIPLGSTASYAEIAQRIGRPKAVRPSRRRASPTRLRLRSLATALCGRMGRCPAIAGALSASARCLNVRLLDELADAAIDRAAVAEL